MPRKGKYRSRLNIIITLLAAALIVFCAARSADEKFGLDFGLGEGEIFSLDSFLGSVLGFEPEADAVRTAATAAGESLEVHFIDVGQGKSILVKGPEKTAVIDCGENDKGTAVLGYLRDQGVESIDFLIGTHPHSDHIGGLDTVIDAFEIGEVIMPDIPDAIVPTTKTYTDVLLALARKGLTISPAEPGDTRDLGGEAVLTLIAPTREYGDLNNLSVVTRLDFGSTSFLFTGDIEEEAEKDILNSGADISVNVLDVAHHGSHSSTCAAFLSAARPDIAVISCGLDNSYGHPHREPVERLQSAGATIYRTDLDGAVVVISDGAALEVITAK